MLRRSTAPITRVKFLTTTGMASGLALTGVGLEGILAARQAPAYPAGSSLHFLLWKNFTPPADVEILRQGADWGKQNNVNVTIEQTNPNDLPALATAAFESKQGPDICAYGSSGDSRASRCSRGAHAVGECGWSGRSRAFKLPTLGCGSDFMDVSRKEYFVYCSRLKANYKDGGKP
jgi:hypothetical protein